MTQLGSADRLERNLAKLTRQVASLEQTLVIHGKTLAKLNEMTSFLATRADVDKPPSRRAVERMSR